MSGKSFIAELRARPGKREELIRLQQELKSLVLAQEPDALVYELFQSEEDPDLFLGRCDFPGRRGVSYHHMHIDFL